jgi:hypothetical protein
MKMFSFFEDLSQNNISQSNVDGIKFSIHLKS